MKAFKSKLGGLTSKVSDALSKNKSVEKVLSKVSGNHSDDLEVLRNGVWPISITYAGFMNKKGNVMKLWKNKYFILIRPNIICYFDEEDSANQLEDFEEPPSIEELKKLIAGTIVLQQDTTIVEVGTDNEWKLEKGSETFEFRCTSSLATSSWINHCRLVVDSLADMLAVSDGGGEEKETDPSSSPAASNQYVYQSASSAEHNTYTYCTEPVDGYNYQVQNGEYNQIHADYDTWDEEEEDEEDEDEEAASAAAPAAYDNMIEDEGEDDNAESAANVLGSRLVQLPLASFRLDKSPLDQFDKAVVHQMQSELQPNGGDQGNRGSVDRPWTQAMEERDWNEDYQLLHEQAVSTPYDMERVTREKEKLVDEFISFSSSVCERISAEVSLPVDQKTLKPIDGAGIAGGEKFKVGSVFFKFARDDKGLYSCDMFAQKAASNEIRAMSAIRECDISGLHTTLTCLLHTRGHCIIATAVAPIGGNPNTIIYGSDDGGVTINKSNQLFNDLARKLARALNLKSHIVTASDKVHLSGEGQLEQRRQGLEKNQIDLDLAVDVEGHLGRDGRFFLVDLARLFPPTPPRRNEVWYFHFRPEFMMHQCMRPMSDDSYAGFGRHNYAEHHKDINIEFKRLMEEIVPATAGQLIQQMNLHYPSQVLHRNGVNVRFYKAILDAIATLEGPADAIWAQSTAIWADMLARCVKQRSRKLLRILSCQYSSQKALNYALIVLLRDVLFGGQEQPVAAAADGANNGCGDREGHRSQCLWESVLRADLYIKFKVETETDGTYYSLFTPSAACPAQWPKEHPTPKALFVAAIGRELGLASAVDDVSRIRSDADAWQAVRAYITRLEDPTFIPLDKLKVVKILPFKRFEEAEKDQLENLKVREQTLGPNHPCLRSTLRALINIYLFWTDNDPQGTKVKCTSVIDRMIQITRQVSVSEQVVDYNFCGQAMYYLAEYEKAIEYFDQSLTHFQNEYGKHAASPEMAGILDNKGQSLTKVGRPQDALPILRIALAVRQKVLGVADRSVSVTLSSIGSCLEMLGRRPEAVEHYLEAIRIMTQVNPDDPEISIIHLSLANAYRQCGAYQEALAAAEKGLEIARNCYSDEHQTTAAAMVGMSMCLLKLGRLDEAAEVGRKGHEILSRTVAKDSFFRAISISNMGEIYLMQEKPQEALHYFEKAHQMYCKLYGGNHPHTLIVMTNLGATYLKLERLEESLEWQLRSLEMRKAMFGEDHTEVMSAYNNLAALYTMMGRYKDAAEYFERDIQNSIAKSGPNNGELITSYINLSTTLRKSGSNLEAAIQYGMQGANLATALMGVNVNSAIGYNNVVYCLMLLKRYEEASSLLQQLYPLVYQTVGNAHQVTCIVMETHTRLLAATGNGKEAVEMAKQALDLGLQVFPDSLRDAGRLYDVMGIAQISCGKHKDAITSLKEAISKRQMFFKTSEHPEVAESQFHLGMTYLYAKKYKDSESYLSLANDTFTKLHLPAKQKDALEQLIALYTAMKNKAMIEKTQAVLDACVEPVGSQ